MVWKFPVQVYRKSGNCWISEKRNIQPYIKKFSKILLHLGRLFSFPENSWKHVSSIKAADFESSYQNFSSHGKRPCFENFQWRMEQHFPEFFEKRGTQPCDAHPNFQICLTRTFRSEISGTFSWIVCFFGNWSIFWKISLEINAVPCVHFWKFSEVLIEWKTPVALNEINYLVFFFAHCRLYVLTVAYTDQWNKIWMPRECSSV